MQTGRGVWQICVNHPDRKVKAKGLCGSCYHRHLFETNPELKKRTYAARRLVRKGQPHNPELNRERQLKHRYGLTPLEYNNLAEAQEFSCASCKDSVEYRLYVDHDHSNGRVRELLCARCNQIAGALEDDKCFNVWEYLRLHKSDALARLELLERGAEGAASNSLGSK